MTNINILHKKLIYNHTILQHKVETKSHYQTV